MVGCTVAADVREKRLAGECAGKGEGLQAHDADDGRAGLPVMDCCRRCCDSGCGEVGRDLIPRKRFGVSALLILPVLLSFAKGGDPLTGLTTKELLGRVLSSPLLPCTPAGLECPDAVAGRPATPLSLTIACRLDAALAKVCMRACDHLASSGDLSVKHMMCT